MNSRQLLATLALALFCAPAFAAWNIASLMGELARNPGGRAVFTEK